jgi:hypothetical protein
MVPKGYFLFSATGGHQLAFAWLMDRPAALLCGLFPAVTMMQSAPARHRNYGCFRRRLWLDRSAGGRIFTEAIVNSIFVMVVHVIADQPTEMWFVQRDDVVENLSPATLGRSAANSMSSSAIPAFISSVFGKMAETNRGFNGWPSMEI